MNGSVNALTQVGNEIIAAGTFTKVSPAGTYANTADDVTRNGIFAFNATNGAINTSFAPSVNGQVRAVDRQDGEVVRRVQVDDPRRVHAAGAVRHGGGVHAEDHVRVREHAVRGHGHARAALHLAALRGRPGQPDDGGRRRGACARRAREVPSPHSERRG